MCNIDGRISLQDINKYITLIRVNFENSYKTQDDTERQLLLRSWYEILKDYPKEICERAVINAIKNSEFAPRIGTVVKEIEKMRVAYEKSDEELWAELTGVLNEVSNNVYRYRFTAIDYNGKTQGDNAREKNENIFEGLSYELKEYCQNLRGLIDISNYTDEQLNFEKGRFLKIIPTIKERAKIRQETDGKIAGLIKGLSSKLSLESGETKLIEGE